MTETDTRHEYNKIKAEPVLIAETVVKKTTPVLADSVLFNAFLQGAGVECNEIRPEQQTETLHRIGQMFRKLIDGTVAVLRSRAEFKSLCRVNMTVIRATNNNPLKFTVSTDDVLRQLLENKTNGFIASTAAIEEAFNDIMNHQLAMQAGIQASLTDLLKTFDPKIIEKQFEQGIVLQKKAKCWDKYEETYRNTVEDAVENFFGEEFVKAYEKQMNLLTKSRGK
jgi:type VI secretion system FHA domain protein